MRLTDSFSLKAVPSMVGLMALAASSIAATAQVPAGIPRELARERAARVSDLHYALHFALVRHAASTEATETLEFTLVDAGRPLLLDYRDGHLKSLKLNGHVLPPEIENGHLVLPAKDLKPGQNTVEASFASSVAPAEKAITRFEDHDDGSEYLYTLFVPMDANMAFPCFDQPDLKGRFQLTLDAPEDWTVISNTDAAAHKELDGGQRETRFEETHPISTYLVAFAAGPFVKVHALPGLPGLYVRKSKAQAAISEAPAVQGMAAQGIRYLSNYFNQPFPFPKYDMVLIPGFAYGGMEHAGATFLREESVLFRTAPTQTNLLNRDILVLHELTHQWFGDFTTMRWFDDLWLKEGFAQYMAYQTLAALKPNDQIWKRFYESIKPAAYAIDETQGTTPIYQNIPNLNDAKSAYGAIVYNKAPGLLKQLAFVLGQENFRKGLDRYLATHAYGNAQWSDLIQAFEDVSGHPLETWAQAWIQHRGMPEVTTAWSCQNGKLTSLTLSQRDVLGGDRVWPIASEVLLGYAGGHETTMRAQWNAQSAAVPEAVGKVCPAYVFANAHDEAYGLFLLDERSRDYVTGHLNAQTGGIADVFERTLLWGSLWQSVRIAEWNPADYAGLVLRDVPSEKDESLTAGLLARSEQALHHYVSADTRRQMSSDLAKLAVERMTNDPDKDLRIVWFRSLTGLAEQEPARSAVKSLLKGETSIPGVKLRQQDRWGLVTALIAYNDPDAASLLSAEEKADSSGDGRKFSYVARAAQPTEANKHFYFNDYLLNPQRPEDWIESSLGAFNYWNQAHLTEPFVKPALDALPEIKRQRKIFFLVGWLDAFLGEQESRRADEEVHQYVKTAGLDEDLRLKVLQAVDELDRTVRIREKYGVK